MLVLASTTEIIQLTLSAGTADVDVSYVDRTATAYPIGATQPTAATASTQTILSSPAASTSREVDWLSLFYKTTGGTVTIQRFNSSGSVTTKWISIVLLAGEQLQYSHAGGWCAIDANGNRKEVTSSNFGAITATSITDSGLTATRVVFSGTGGLLSDNSGFTFATTGAILTAGAINVAGTTAPTTGWYNPSGTLLRTPNAVTIDGASTLSSALTYGGVTLTNAVTGTGKMVLDTNATMGAFTLGGTVSGGGQNLNNVIIGAVTPLAGSFTTLAASGFVDFSANTRMANGAAYAWAGTADYIIGNTSTHNIAIVANSTTVASFSAGATNITGAFGVSGAFGCNGASVQTASTGYGTPTNGAKQASFDATAITLVNLAKATAQLIIDLKAIGFLAA